MAKSTWGIQLFSGWPSSLRVRRAKSEVPGPTDSGSEAFCSTQWLIWQVRRSELRRATLTRITGRGWTAASEFRCRRSHTALPRGRLPCSGWALPVPVACHGPRPGPATTKVRPPPAPGHGDSAQTRRRRSESQSFTFRVNSRVSGVALRRPPDTKADSECQPKSAAAGERKTWKLERIGVIRV